MRTTHTKPRIIIADDHKVFRQGLKTLFENEEIAQVVGEASNGDECIEMAAKLNPDIILMDIDMPNTNGIEAAQCILRNNQNINIIALSMHDDYDHYQQMVKIGAKGFIQKSSGIDEVIKAVTAVQKGGTYFSNETLRAIIANYELLENEKSGLANTLDLTRRELEVLNLICQGLTNEQIAQQLFISPTTVKGHRANLLSKTGAKNTAALIIFAVKNKLVEL